MVGIDTLAKPRAVVLRGLSWQRIAMAEVCHGRGLPWQRVVMAEGCHGRGWPWQRVVTAEGGHGRGWPALMEWNALTPYASWLQGRGTHCLSQSPC